MIDFKKIDFKNEDVRKALTAAAVAIPVMLILLGAYSYSRPYTYVVRGEAAIVCNDGERVYPAVSNNIRAVDALYSYSTDGSQIPDEAKDDDARARKLCAYGVTRDMIPFRRAPKEVNYSVRPGTSSPVDTASNSGVTLSKE